MQVSGPEVHEQVSPPFAESVVSVAVTVYPVMGEPPVDVGAVQVTVAVPLPAVAATADGAPGTVIGITELDAPEAGPVPTALMAATEKV